MADTPRQLFTIAQWSETFRAVIFNWIANKQSYVHYQAKSHSHDSTGRHRTSPRIDTYVQNTQARTHTHTHTQSTSRHVCGCIHTHHGLHWRPQAWHRCMEWQPFPWTDNRQHRRECNIKKGSSPKSLWHTFIDKRRVHTMRCGSHSLELFKCTLQRNITTPHSLHIAMRTQQSLASFAARSFNLLNSLIRYIHTANQPLIRNDTKCKKDD